MARAECSEVSPGNILPRAFAFVPDHLDLIGDESILRTSPVGLLCSGRPPGSVVLRTFELFQRLKHADGTVAGGFHSPLERQCLDLLLEGRARILVVPARGLSALRIPAGWKRKIDQGAMAVVSPFPRQVRRATRALAEQRNLCVAFLSSRLFVPFASSGGLAERIALETAAAGIPVMTFDIPENAVLLRHGANLIESDATNCYLHACEDVFGPQHVNCPASHNRMNPAEGRNA